MFTILSMNGKHPTLPFFVNSGTAACVLHLFSCINGLKLVTTFTIPIYTIVGKPNSKSFPSNFTWSRRMWHAWFQGRILLTGSHKVRVDPLQVELRLECLLHLSCEVVFIAFHQHLRREWVIYQVNLEEARRQYGMIKIRKKRLKKMEGILLLHYQYYKNSNLKINQDKNISLSVIPWLYRWEHTFQTSPQEWNNKSNALWN